MCFLCYSTDRDTDKKWKLGVVCGFGYDYTETKLQEERQNIFTFKIAMLVTCKTKKLHTLLM